MSRLSNLDLIRVWETGFSQSAVKRACGLARALHPDASSEEIASLPVGVRDFYLMKFREQVFGKLLHCYANCPQCQAGLELSFPIDDLCRQSHDEGNDPFVVKCAGYEMSVRLPNSNDLASLDDENIQKFAERHIFDRCILSTNRDGNEINSREIPAEVVREVSQHMAERDPQGNVTVEITCPECDHQWNAPFDIASYLWDELHVWSSRMLRDVHLLASAYGWSESEILKMSPQRRRFYQEMING